MRQPNRLIRLLFLLLVSICLGGGCLAGGTHRARQPDNEHNWPPRTLQEFQDGKMPTW